MLQGKGNDSRAFILICLLGAMASGSCRPDTSGNTSEREAYFADYEKQEHHWGFIDTSGHIIIAPIYDEVSQFSERKAAVNLEGLWGYIDRSGHNLIKPQYKSAFAFHDRRARVQDFEQHEFFISPQGQQILSADWKAADNFSEGFAKVHVGSNFGFIDTAGRMAIRPIYTRARNFQSGLSVVEFQGKQGVIDQRGGYVIEPKFSLIKFEPPYRWLIGQHGDSTFLFDHGGHVIWQMANSSFIETNGNLIAIRKDRQCRLYDLSSLKPLPGPAYGQIHHLGNQLWACKSDSLYWILDDEGQKISRLGYNQINQYEDGFAAFSRNGYWGYLDTLGHEAAAPLFGLAWDFKEGFARAVFKEGLAYVNLKLQLAFYPPPGSIDLRDFSEGLAPVRFTR